MCRESARDAPATMADAQDGSIDIARRHELLERLKAAMAKRGTWDPEVSERLWHSASQVLERMASDGPDVELTPRQRLAREAIVIADGSRPLVPVRDDDVDLDGEPLSTFWRDALILRRRSIRRVLRSVGRLGLSGGASHAGTAWVIGDGLIATNRHVLENLASEDAQGWDVREGCVVDFVAEEGRTVRKQFPVKRVRFCSDGPLADEMDISQLDIAVLEVSAGSGALRFPAPLEIAGRSHDTRVGGQIYTVGYPGRPLSAGPTGGTPELGHEFEDVLDLLLGGVEGVKRLSPGFVTEAFQTASPAVRCLGHDASTLGGSSGSPMVDLGGDGAIVIGLHLGGVARDGNHAHALAELGDFLRNGLGQLA